MLTHCKEPIPPHKDDVSTALFLLCTRATCLRKCISRVERSSVSILVWQFDSIIMSTVSADIYISLQVSLRLSQEQGTSGTTTMLKFSVRFLSPSRKFLSGNSDYITVYSFYILSNPSRTNLEFIRCQTSAVTHSVGIKHTWLGGAEVSYTSSHCSTSSPCSTSSHCSTWCSNTNMQCYD